jgi:hypothetical protein
VCGSFWGVEKFQNRGRFHGKQGANNVKFTPNFTNFCSNVSCRFMKFDERNHFFNPPFFISMATAAKFVQSKSFIK